MAKLDHVAVEVSDLDAAIEFYEEKIGLKFLFKKNSKDSTINSCSSNSCAICIKYSYGIHW